MYCKATHIHVAGLYLRAHVLFVGQTSARELRKVGAGGNHEIVLQSEPEWYFEVELRVWVDA
jgi:hypothetical protein